MINRGETDATKEEGQMGIEELAVQFHFCLPRTERKRGLEGEDANHPRRSGTKRRREPGIRITERRKQKAVPKMGQAKAP